MGFNTTILNRVGNSLYTLQQTVLSTVVKLKGLRGDADCYQKVCQAAYASFQLMMINHPAPAFFGNLSNVVSAVSMHDFYRFVKQPRSFFFPVTARTIDENKVLREINLAVINQLQNPLGKEPVTLSEQDKQNIQNTVKDCLCAQLESMDQHDDAYRSVDEFLVKVNVPLANAEIEDDLPALMAVHSPDSNSIFLRQSPPLEKLMNVTWGVVDIMTPTFMLKEWKLLDTAKYAEQVGQIPGFQWVKNQSLEVCLIGGVCAGYALKILESFRKLSVEALTNQEKRQARWNAVTSVAELAFFGSIFMNLIGKTKINSVHLQLLALGAKSLGVLSIATRPQYAFFQEV